MLYQTNLFGSLLFSGCVFVFLHSSENGHLNQKVFETLSSRDFHCFQINYSYLFLLTSIAVIDKTSDESNKNLARKVSEFLNL